MRSKRIGPAEAPVFRLKGYYRYHFQLQSPSPGALHKVLRAVLPTLSPPSGVELAVDDFGTGYSSLGYLRQFPLDRIKIDQSFIRNATTNRDDQMIARAIISLSHNLGLKVLAEGVETDAHANFLKQEGCDEAQGYKYAKPLPEEDFIAFAKNFSA